jgi:nucleoside phosphorylase
MKLLTFAHRAEAQAFFKNDEFRNVDFIFNGLFKSRDYYLLLTDEGLHSASEKTIASLSIIHPDIDEVINLGVAGSLSKKYKKNDLLWIRTSMAHHAEKLEFKSYSSQGKNSAADCMSAYTRVLSASDRHKLSLFADVVDRELWAIASAASLFKLPFSSLKIISDDLTHHEEGHEICQLVKEEAHLFSEKLFMELQTVKAAQKPVNKVSAPKEFYQSEAFYFTTTQERKLKSLLEGLRVKNISIPQELVDDLLSLQVLPKERSRLLLIELNDLLNPFAKKMRDALDSSLDPLTKAGISAQYNSNLEQSQLNLSMAINCERDLERVKNALKIFSYSDYKNIFDGKF